MTNFFQILGQPVSPQIDPQAIEETYRDLSKSAHPDQGGSTEEFERLTLAKNTLLDPVSRLEHLLLVKNHEGSTRGSLSPVIADQFQTVAEVLQQTDLVVAEIEKAQSALQKALLQPKILKCQSDIGDVQQTVASLESEILANLGDQTPLEAVAQAARDLAFTRRWKGQLQSKFAALWAL